MAGYKIYGQGMGGKGYEVQRGRGRGEIHRGSDRIKSNKKGRKRGRVGIQKSWRSMDTENCIVPEVSQRPRSSKKAIHLHLSASGGAEFNLTFLFVVSHRVIPTSRSSFMDALMLS